MIQPFRSSFFAVLLAAGAIGFGFATWHSSGTIDSLNGQIKLRDDQIETKDEQVERYKLALGIVPGAKGNLMELTSQELSAKAMNKALELHSFCTALHEKIDTLPGPLAMKALKEAGEVFNRTLGADAYLLDNELRRRLDPKAVAAIPNIDQSFKGNDGTPVDPMSLFDNGNHVGGLIACQLAGTLQRLARVLPITSKPQPPSSFRPRP